MSLAILVQGIQHHPLLDKVSLIGVMFPTILKSLDIQKQINNTNFYETGKHWLYYSWY